MAVPRVVDGIGGAVVGIAGGEHHSLVTTAEGRVLAFGGKSPFAACGGLGLGAGVEEALTPTAIGGITMDAGPGRVEELGRLIEESEAKKAEAVARYAEELAEELRRIEEDKERHKAEKAALEKKIAEKATEAAKEGKEGKE